MSYPSLAMGVRQLAWSGAAGRLHGTGCFWGGGGLRLARCQRTFVSAGSFASTLPTYQQSEVMVFIMNKVPLPSLQQSIEAGKAG